MERPGVHEKGRRRDALYERLLAALRCLGFAGQCHLDPVVARFIRDTPAELISVCLGSNVYRHCTFSARSFVPAVTGFLQTVRDGHPDTPLVVMTPIVYPTGEREPNAVGLTLADIRALLHEAVDVMRDCGHRGLQLVDGLGVLRPEEAHLLVDAVHPGTDGYRLMASRLGPLLRPHMARSTPRTTATDPKKPDRGQRSGV